MQIRDQNAEEALKHPWFTKFEMKQKYDCVPKEEITLFINNLKSYKTEYKIQEAAIAIIVHNIPHSDEIKELEKAFRNIDSNKDGKLTKEELAEGFNSFFPDKTKEENMKEVDRIFKNVDADNNGFIEYEEFVRACIDKKILLNNDYLKFAFSFFDTDKSGTITINELKQVFCSGGANIPHSVFQQIMGNIDIDGNGQISFDEFKEVMQKILV